MTKNKTLLTFDLKMSSEKIQVLVDIITLYDDIKDDYILRIEFSDNIFEKYFFEIPRKEIISLNIIETLVDTIKDENLIYISLKYFTRFGEPYNLKFMCQKSRYVILDAFL